MSCSDNEELLFKIKEYLKKGYKKIDIKIINCIIKDIFLGNGHRYTDGEILTVIKGLCYHYISHYYENYEIKIIPQKKIDEISNMSNTNGLKTNTCIYLSRELALDIRNFNIEILRVAMHEVQHVFQTYLIETGNISYRNYLLCCEQVILNEMGNSYYEENYYYLFDEIDARWQAEVRLYEYLKVNIPSLLKQYLPEIQFISTKSELELAHIMRICNKKQVRKEELLDRIIARRPDYLKEYPLLKFYYNKNGTKIPVSQLFLRAKVTVDGFYELDMDNLRKLDEFVILNRDGTRQNIEKDIKSLSFRSITRLCFQDANVKKKIDDVISKLSDRLANDKISVHSLHNTMIEKIKVFKEKIIMLKE